jgi:ABC-type iron transport system FetAB ATPase subunit
LGAAEISGQRGETIDIDAPEWAEKAPALVRPADASQHSALIDMAAGHHLAIEGPPGTGKSETITNIIATAVSAGKKVLFVAEKQAALRVVADRLRASGLGPLLLELHGDNVNRTEFYESLRQRHPAPKITVDAGKLASQRQHCGSDGTCCAATSP